MNVVLKAKPTLCEVADNAGFINFPLIKACDAENNSQMACASVASRSMRRLGARHLGR